MRERFPARTPADRGREATAARSGAEQREHGGGLVRAGEARRVRALVGAQRRVGAVAEQQRGDRVVVVLRGRVQRREPAGLDRVGIGAGLEQQARPPRRRAPRPRSAAAARASSFSAGSFGAAPASSRTATAGAPPKKHA